ncbi:MAG: LacI family DNA-binding transcriptional regulator [Gammaproteobacteria bacterium]|nr:LacI family DNA-binding transcriptional regulator [Gammaproteobacteria bacterium]
MVKETITSLDVARAAGVSQSAVSRVFTPGASVSPTMRQRVEEAANKLGYRPNALARSLITGKSRIIGLVLAYLENQFYPDALEKLSHALQKRGYHVLVFFASDATDNIDAVLEEILDYQVDGIVLASASLSFELAGRCHDAGVPVVLFNRRQNDEGISYVTSDNYAGGRKLARFLADGGHQRIGYIAGWEGAATQIDREAGFLAGLSEVNLELFAREVGDYKWELAAEATRRMFSRKDRPDAVFVANDHMAFATLEVLRHEFSLRVPDDVSVVSYDDVLLSSWPSFNLTTLRQPINRMVDATVEALLARIEEDDTVLRRVAIDGPLVIRGSSRVPRA